MSRKFLVAVDGSDHSCKALDMAVDLANGVGAELIITHVIPREPIPAGLEQYAEIEGFQPGEAEARFRYSRKVGDKIAADAEARARLKKADGVEVRVVEGNAAKQIVALASSEGVEMIFLGSRGLGDVKGLLMGSVSHKVMNLAPCTCVAVK